MEFQMALKLVVPKEVVKMGELLKQSLRCFIKMF